MAPKIDRRMDGWLVKCQNKLLFSVCSKDRLTGFCLYMYL